MSLHCCSVAQSYPTLCHPRNGSAPGFPVLHYLPELTQTHVHWVSDAIEPFHPMLSPSPSPSCLQSFPASGSFLMSRHFPSGGQSIGKSVSASVLLMNIQDWFLLRLMVWSPCSSRDSQESSSTPQFKSTTSLALTSIYYSWKNHSLTIQTFISKVMSLLCGLAGKESACNVGDLGSIPGLGRSPGKGKGYPLQNSGLENPMGWIVHGVKKSQTQLSHFHFYMTHSS